MKNLISLVGRFSVFAVFAVTPTNGANEKYNKRAVLAVARDRIFGLSLW
jgi:hypothetical protein